MNDFSSQEIVKRFCMDPQDPRKLNKFFYFSAKHTVAYLRVLYRNGYPLPIERANLDKATSDIAIGLLDKLFLSKPQQPYFSIFDFLRRRGITDFKNATAECLHNEITILLRGNAKKALYRRRQIEHSPAEKLKRNIRAALKAFVYHSFMSPIGEEMVCLEAHRENLRPNREKILPTDLFELVQSAYNHPSSHQAPSWLKKIFDELAQKDEVQNAVSIYELLAAMVAVWANARDDIYLRQHRPSLGLAAMLFELVAAEIPVVIKWAEETLISRFLSKRKMASDDISDYLTALQTYLLDFSAGDADDLPKYLYLLRPSLKSVEYQQRYKHTFETVLNDSRARFCDILRKNPTIRSLWDYLH